MAREVIRPMVGQEPIIVMLDTDEPTQVEGNYGVEYQYTLNGDAAIMWLKKEAKAAIDATGARAGDEIAISKIKRGRSDVWIAERVKVEATPHQPTAIADHRSDRTPAWVKQPEPQPKPQAAAAAPAASPEPKPNRPGAALLAAALYAAIDAASAAEAYAREKGRAIAFGEDSIRAMAATLYIDARKESR